MRLEHRVIPFFFLSKSVLRLQQHAFYNSTHFMSEVIFKFIIKKKEKIVILNRLTAIAAALQNHNYIFRCIINVLIVLLMLRAYGSCLCFVLMLRAYGSCLWFVLMLRAYGSADSLRWPRPAS